MQLALRPRARFSRSPAARFLAALALALVPAAVAVRALADEPPAPAAAPAPADAPASKRLTALQHEIRHLERHLQALRRARADLAAGRPEALPADGPAFRAAEATQRALREIQRYEAARARAVAHLAEAGAASDAEQAAAARAALDKADDAFVAAMDRDEAKAAGDDAAPAASTPTKSGRKRSKPDTTGDAGRDDAPGDEGMGG